MDATPSVDAASGTPEKHPRRFRVPTPIILDPAGLVLSAWLLPAFTRQWDDRQKAHEVKSSVVSEIAAASAHSLTGGEAIWYGRTS